MLEDMTAPIPSQWGYYATTEGEILSEWEAGCQAGPFGDLHPMKPKTVAKGYLALKLSGDRYVGIHRLVCEAFYGPAPTANHQASHLDHDQTNNRPENLRWETAAENNARSPVALGERNGQSKLSAGDVSEIRRRRAKGELLRVIAEDYGVARSHVGGICRGAFWKHVGTAGGFNVCDA